MLRAQWVLRLLRIPVLVLVAGWLTLAALTAFGAWRHRPEQRPGWLHRVAFHGGIDDHVETEVLGGRLLAVTGGIRLDLREAQPGGEHMELQVSAVMGGIQVLVPDDWRVELQASAWLGGVANDACGAEGPLLRVQALAVMGGVHVANRSPGEDEVPPATS